MALAFNPGTAASFGHHFILGLQPEPFLTDHDKRLLESLRPAGVILFRRNFRHEHDYDVWLHDHAKLIADIRACVGRDELLIAIDHEGGPIVRPPPPITAFAAASGWADRAEHVARAMAIELRSLGVNLSFAPVVDIDSNPENPVIGNRAFGSDPQTVIEAASAFVAGLHAEGLLSCPKHYPGHGDTSVDSHHDLPCLDLDLAELHQRELLPFGAMAKLKVPMVMTAHILFPKIDPDRPATLSRRLINDVLRGELGYQGVVVSDDIGMKAISKRFESPDAPRLSLEAGSDLIMVCSYLTDTNRALTMAEHLAKDWQEGALDRGMLEASFRRIDALLSAAPRHEVTRLPDTVWDMHAQAGPLRADAIAAVAAQAGETCVTVRNV